MEKPLRLDRMSGLDAGQLDELERRVGELLGKPWDKGKGRPRELTLREALVVTSGYMRQKHHRGGVGGDLRCEPVHDLAVHHLSDAVGRSGYRGVQAIRAGGAGDHQGRDRQPRPHSIASMFVKQLVRVSSTGELRGRHGMVKIDTVQRYMHVPDELRQRITLQLGGLPWKAPEDDDPFARLVRWSIETQ